MDNLEYWQRANQILGKIDNDEFLLLKGHLLIEELIDRRISYYIEDIHFKRLNLSFIKKIDLLCGLKSLSSKDEFIELIRDLNKLRNKIAHDLDYDIKVDVILFIKKGDGGVLPKTINRKQLI